CTDRLAQRAARVDGLARPQSRYGSGGLCSPAARARPARRDRGVRRMTRASHRQPGFVAALLHRLSGLALAIFLPLHFLAPAVALNGAAPLDPFLAVTRHPVLKVTEWALVVALAMHMALGLRVLAIEFLPWRDRTAATVSTCIGVGFLAGLLLLLNGA